MFIDFEGIDGSGKTTLSNLVAQRLARSGYKITHAREGGELRSATARRLRELTRDPALLELVPRAELLLNVARDIQQLEEVIRPALARGEVVISDRYLHSQLALSVGGRGLGEAAVAPVLELAADGHWPDLVVLVDVDPDLAQLRKRLSRAGVQKDVGSRKGLGGAGLQVRVRESFLEQARRDPQRWVVFENDGVTLHELADRIAEVVRARLEHREPEVRPLSPARRRAPQPEGLEAAFFAAYDELELREPPLALMMLRGLGGPSAQRRRLRAAEELPALVARSLTYVDDEDSFTLRQILAATAPAEVAESLLTDGSARALGLRAQLFDRAPGKVAESLVGLDDPRAWELRERALELGLWPEVLTGLAQVESAGAFELREVATDKGLEWAVARSLAGVGGERADGLRERLWAQNRLAAVRSTLGVDSPVANRIREALAPLAPKLVLRALVGLDSAHAHGLRRRWAKVTKEALESLRGLDSPEAYALREQHLQAWPAAVLESLVGVPADERKARLLARGLALRPGRLMVLRNAYAATVCGRRPRTEVTSASALASSEVAAH